jgi:hypothetical protein
LLLGGIFLFFCADLDLYRPTDWRQLRDREVQLHKSIAIVLMVIGSAGLLRKSHKKQRATTAVSQQSKVIAVMALIGGGLLFTHVHTVAPYANVAAGVYIAHVCMGIVALSIGASRLLQDGFPKYRRAFAISFALFMCVESILLVTYNEGLPWYIGYGRYNRWGPHDGTVAPYGAIRAELTFDNKNQAMDVYVLDRFKDQPVGVAANDVNVIVSQGYDDLAIPLHRVADSATSPDEWSHFRGLAPSLRDVPGFCARLALPVGSHMKTGYFDPWVTPVIKWVPPNEVAHFQCPMHEGVLSETPGDCPLCGMPMAPIQRGPRTTLHDPGYEMALAASPQQAAMSDVGLHAVDVKAIDERTLRLNFTPQFQGQTLHDLAVVHEHLLHLIVVSQDLSFFDHIHPLVQPNGSLAITYTFPSPGRYLLFADITPRGQRSQVFRFPVSVGSTSAAETPSAPLTPSPTYDKPLESDPTITAELIPQPRTISAGIHTDLLFRLSQNGRPISDLEPYLGAMGHCVAISQDTQTYLHCHPEQLFTPTKDARGGPFVDFHTIFPTPGRYKIWAQFQRAGKILVADFVVDVKSPILPPKLINFILDD